MSEKFINSDLKSEIEDIDQNDDRTKWMFSFPVRWFEAVLRMTFPQSLNFDCQINLLETKQTNTFAICYSVEIKERNEE